MVLHHTCTCHAVAKVKVKRSTIAKQRKMAKSACICQNRSSPLPREIQYPTTTYSDVDSAEALLEKHGYFVIRGLFTSDEVKQVCDEISSVCAEWYDKFVKTGKEGSDWEEIVNRRPAWKDGSWQPEPGEEELGFRRLFRVCAEKEFFARAARHEKVNST